MIVHSVQKSIFTEMLLNELHNDEEFNSSSSEEDEQDQSEDEDQQNEANNELIEEDCEDVVEANSSSNSVSTFKELKICSWILRQLSCLGISTPSPVQANCIPPILEGKWIITRIFSGTNN